MSEKRRSIRKDKRAFTGLEAAIVLTAFVVVAAVFSYVVLNAGFFTTQKAKEVVHTGIEQATSSVEVAGDVMALCAGNEVTGLNITLQLTAGQNPVDLTGGQTVISYQDKNEYMDNVTWTTTWLSGSSSMLDPTETVLINLEGWSDLPANTPFAIEIKPPAGATLSIPRVSPSDVSDGIKNLH
jgi:flagellin FlaB